MFLRGGKLSDIFEIILFSAYKVLAKLFPAREKISGLTIFQLCTTTRNGFYSSSLQQQRSKELFSVCNRTFLTILLQSYTRHLENNNDIKTN